MPTVAPTITPAAVAPTTAVPLPGAPLPGTPLPHVASDPTAELRQQSLAQSGA
ncbi:hypothetical protein ACIOEX_07080 [Streptomyces sp. NPDC087850]|uniref:hypothetical protein n=1 Tax=Streptomyces sp. NPDC087850 TaxID=3365809 RepID=UPI0038095A28